VEKYERARQAIDENKTRAMDFAYLIAKERFKASAAK
jgi:hypothetical protein